MLHRFMTAEGMRNDDPTADFDGIKVPAGIPKPLSEDEVESLLAAVTGTEPVALRDRALLELLYASGLRVSELVGLSMQQINLQHGLVRVTGKGQKERLVPMGEEAAHWLRLYLQQGRGLLLGGQLLDVVFPSSRAQQMTRQTFWHRPLFYAKVAASNGL